jgi:Domain of unknown function (DUF4267)
MASDVPAEIDRSMRIGSLSGVLVILVAFGIIFIGVREFLFPSIGSLGFGLPLHDPHDADLLAVKAVRDVVSGILALTFLGLRNRRLLAYGFGVLTLIPLLDGPVVLRHAGWSFTPVLVVHWGTAAFMLVIVELIRRRK